MMFEKPGVPMQQVAIQLPVPGPGEILVRNKFATICGSDLHTYCGTRKEQLPTVLGHEIVGEIAAFGADCLLKDQKGTDLCVGDRVTWSIFSSDPGSYYALQGMPQKGEGLFKYGHALFTESDAFHGGFGEYCLLKQGTAVLKIPDTLPLSVAATLNCAIATVAGGIRLAGNLDGKNVLIFGMGLLGLTCAAMCRDAGAAGITAVDLSQERLKEATGFGADQMLLMNENTESQLNETRNKWPRKGYDIVFDMSGSPDALELGMEVLAIGGIAIWIGTVFRARKIAIDAEKVVRGLITIKGLHNYNYEDFIYALDFMTRSWKNYGFQNVVEKTFLLSEVNEAFEYALREKPLRVGVEL